MHPIVLALHLQFFDPKLGLTRCAACHARSQRSELSLYRKNRDCCWTIRQSHDGGAPLLRNRDAARQHKHGAAPSAAIDVGFEHEWLPLLAAFPARTALINARYGP